MRGCYQRVGFGGVASRRVVPSLAVIVITHDTKVHTLALLASLARDPSFPSWEVVLVDNDSRDRTSEAVADLYPSVQRLYNSPQLGFAGALNQGIRATAAPFAVTINPDA